MAVILLCGHYARIDPLLRAWPVLICTRCCTAQPFVIEQDAA